MCFLLDGIFKLQNKTNLGLNGNTKVNAINFKYDKSFTGKRFAESLP